MYVNSPADSFVVIKVDNEEVFKIEMQYNALFPKWNESVRFLDFKDNEVVSIHVFDYNEVNDNEHIGEFQLDLQSLAD